MTQQLKQEPKRYWSPAQRWRNVAQGPVGKEETLWIFKQVTFFRPVRGISRNIGGGG
jgi:hypothetical protein